MKAGSTRWIVPGNKTVAIFWRTVRPLDMANQNSEPSDKICSGNDPVALQRLNERNQQFWNEQSKLMGERISNPALYKIAMDDMNFEILRGVPVKLRKSLERALADAAGAKGVFHANLSRMGGRARKSDALQDLILELVGEDLDMTESELLDKLKVEAGAGVVISIDEPSDLLADDIQYIHFVNDDERPKRASVYGLKDRLSRAKTKIKNSR
jgi:hypothetical protein